MGVRPPGAHVVLLCGLSEEQLSVSKAPRALLAGPGPVATATQLSRTFYARLNSDFFGPFSSTFSVSTCS